MGDNSIRIYAIGGPQHGSVFRSYDWDTSDVDELILDNGKTVEVYLLREGEVDKWSTWNYVHDVIESAKATEAKYGRH